MIFEWFLSVFPPKAYETSQGAYARIIALASLLGAGAVSTFAIGADLAARTGELGLVPPGIKSIPTSAGLKIPRTVSTTSDEFADMIGSAAWSVKLSRPALYGGFRVKPGHLQSGETVRGILYPLSGRWLSTVETTVSEQSALAPRQYTFASRLHATLGRGWNFSVGLKHSVFGTESGAAYGSVGAYGTAPMGSALAPSLYSGSASATTYQLKFNYLYNQHNVVGLSYTAGKGDYLYSSLDWQLHDTHQFTLTGQHWLTPNWSLNYDVYAPDSANFLQRQGLRLGLRYRF